MLRFLSIYLILITLLIGINPSRAAEGQNSKTSITAKIVAKVRKEAKKQIKRYVQKQVTKVAIKETKKQFATFFDNYIQTKIPEDRVNDLKTIRANLLKFMLETSYKSDEEKLETFQFAKIYLYDNIYKWYENLMIERGLLQKPYHEIDLPPPWKLKDEVDYLKSKYKSSDWDVVKKYEDLVFEIVSHPQIENFLLNKTNKLLENSPNLSPFIEINWLKIIPSDRDETLKFLYIVEERVNGFVSMMQNMGALLADSDDIKIEPEEVKILIKEFLGFYFANVPRDVLKNIINDMMLFGKIPDNNEAIRILFRNSGPGLGKMLQQVCEEEGVSEDFKALVKFLESENKVVPIHLVDPIINGDKGGFSIVSINPKPLGTGTVAQTNRVIISINGSQKEKAVRFLKPGIVEMAHEDLRIFDAFLEYLRQKQVLTGGLNLEEVLNSSKKFLLQELQMMIANQRQKEAAQYYSRVFDVNHVDFDSLEIYIPKVYDAPNGKSELQVMDVAPGGVKFSEIEDQSIQKIVSNKLTYTWFKEALFGSGFIHSDLHQGNFKVLIDKKNRKIIVSVFDLGMAQFISKKTQRSFLLFSAGAALNDTKLIYEAIKSFGFSKLKKKQIIKMLKEKAKESNGAMVPEKWIVWAIQYGLVPAEEIGPLARGGALLMQLPKIAQSQDETMNEIKDVALNAIKSSPLQFPLKVSDGINIGKQAVKSVIKQKCRDLVKKFF